MANRKTIIAQERNDTKSLWLSNPPPNKLDMWHNACRVKRGKVYILEFDWTVVVRRPCSSSYHASWHLE